MQYPRNAKYSRQNTGIYFRVLWKEKQDGLFIKIKRAFCIS